MIVLPFKEFNLQIFPLNMFWYVFSSDIVKFIITFPLSTSFIYTVNILKYIYTGAGHIIRISSKS